MSPQNVEFTGYRSIEGYNSACFLITPGQRAASGPCAKGDLGKVEFSTGMCHINYETSINRFVSVLTDGCCPPAAPAYVKMVPYFWFNEKLSATSPLIIDDSRTVLKVTPLVATWADVQAGKSLVRCFSSQRNTSL